MVIYSNKTIAKIRSIKEAYSMQPETIEVGKDLWGWDKNGKISRGIVSAIEQYDDVIVAYNETRQIMLCYQKDSVNIQYFTEEENK